MSPSAALVCLAGSLLLGQGEKVVFRAGPVEVKQERATDRPRRGGEPLLRRALLIDHVVYGAQFVKPADPAAAGDPERDFSRQPSTYYHPKGPAGVALGRFNWFPEPANTYAADARLPAALAALGGDPLGQLVAAWSEPPVLVVGLEAGDLAGYARPYQVFDFIEPNATVIGLSQPAKGGDPVFTQVRDARARGAHVRIFHGPPRAMLEERAGAGFYHVVLMNPYNNSLERLHTDLMTQEGMDRLSAVLAPGGVLGYHISNRYYDLEPALAAAADALGLFGRHGMDQGGWKAQEEDVGHYASSWVLLSRTPAPLARLPEQRGRFGAGLRWEPLAKTRRPPWRDGAAPSFRGLYRSDPALDRLDSQLARAESFLIQGGYLPARTRDLLRPVHTVLRNLGGAVAELRNR